MHTLGLLTNKLHCLNLGQLIEKQFILNLSNVDTIFFFSEKKEMYYFFAFFIHKFCLHL